MATRSRTLLFLQYRSSFSRSHASHLPHRGNLTTDEESAGLIANEIAGDTGDSVAIEMSVLPPQWVDVMDELDEDIRRVKDQLTSLETLHRQQLLAGLEDTSTTREAEIEHLTDHITIDLRKAQAKVKRVGAAAKSAGDTSEGALARNVQSAMASKLQEVSATLRTRQSAYLDQLRGRESRTKEFLVDDDIFQGDFGFEDSIGGSLSQSQVRQVNGMNEVISARDAEISAISRSVAELADIFQELSSLVIDQGTLLDRIDYNIEQVHTHMRQGAKELDEGATYQKRENNRRVIILIILAIALLVVIIFIRFTGEAPPPPPPTETLLPPPTPAPTPDAS